MKGKINWPVFLISIVISLWWVLVVSFVWAPYGIYVFLPLALLIIGIMLKNKIAWWLGAVVFSLAGILNLLWIVAVDLNVVRDAIINKQQLCLRPVGLAMLFARILVIISAGLYFKPSIRNR